MVRGPIVFAVAALLWLGSMGVIASADAALLAQDDGRVEATASAWTMAPAGTPRSYAAAPAPMEFVCPEPVGTQFGPSVTPQDTGNQVLVVYGCPYRVYDSDNPFGNVALAVRHDNVAQMAFSTLHGQTDPNGPSDVSRQSDTHTVFMTADQGSSWQDEYTDPGFPNSAARGESSDIVMDEDGNIYVMLKWSRPQAGGWQGFLGLYKGGTADEARSVKDSYLYGKYITPVATEGDPRANPGGSITDGGLVFVQDTNMPPPPEWNNQTNDIYGEEGDAAVEYAPGEERIVAMWHQQTALNTTNSEGWTGWIDAAWSDVGGGNKWTSLDPDQRIGPCSDASRPVHFQGDVYVVCTVAKGYDARSRARIGDQDVWRLDMETNTTQFMGHTRLRGGEPQLTSTEDGYMVAATFRVIEKGELNIKEPSMHFSVGWYGKAWATLGGDVGRQFNQIGGNHDILDAHLTALQVTEDDRTIFAIYKEWIDEEQPEAPNFDPDDPTATTPHLTDYRKIMVAFDECGNFPIAAAEFDLGGGMDAYNFRAYQENAGIYNDEQDGLQVVRDQGTDEELLYFAVNDYGAVQFGAVMVDSTASTCIVAQPLLPPPPAAIPQALTFGSPASIITGSIVALPLAGMVGYLLTVKRRTAQFVAAEDE